MSPIIISLAPVKAGAPIDKESLADDVKKSVDAGASLCHLHARDTKGQLSSDIRFMAECFDAILARTDVIVQTSTGGVSDMSMQERCLPLEYPQARSASLNGGSTNLGDAVYINSPRDILYSAKAVYAKRILPEIEVFSIGMLKAMENLRGQTDFAKPFLVNLVFGHPGGMPATLEALYAFKQFLPADTLWGVTHYGRDHWTFIAGAIAAGASLVRIGFEDSPYLSPEETASMNAPMVQKLSHLIHTMDLQVATPNQARQILNLRP